MRRWPLMAAGLVAGAMALAIAPAGASSGTVTVKLGEYFFTPKKITIKRGTTVRFVNVGKVAHTVADTSKSGSIRSRVIKPRPLKRGASQTVTFRKPGTIYYRCTFHPQLMRGVIVVR